MEEKPEVLTEEDVAKTMADEMDTFVPPEFIELSGGKKIPFPKLSWKKEKLLFKEIGQILEEVTELQDFSFESATIVDMLKMAGHVMDKVPERITTLVILATDLNEEEVDNNLDSGDIISILFPLFKDRATRLAQAIGS
jgi:hypothetical protein